MHVFDYRQQKVISHMLYKVIATFCNFSFKHFTLTKAINKTSNWYLENMNPYLFGMKFKAKLNR